jgi:hypothetical protein
LLLLITGSTDGTIDRLIHAIDEPVFRLNHDLLDQYKIFFDPNGWSISDPTGRTITSKTVIRVFWWKAFHYFRSDLDPMIRAEFKYILREIYGWSIQRGIVKGNPPSWHEYNGKINIQRLAESVGFPCPRTAVFVGASNVDGMPEGLVAKSLASQPALDGKVLYSTRVKNGSFHPQYPWFIQTEVESDWDVTVFICDRQFWAFKRNRSDLPGIDWRTEQDLGQSGNHWELFQLSELDINRLQALNECLKVEIGRHDFMIDRRTGELVFLEFNATGQWVFLDYNDTHNLVGSVARWLLK